MSTTYQADNVTPPRAGFVIALATGAAAASTTIPASLQGRFVTMIASVDTYILFATTSGITATSGVGGIGATNGVSGRIVADTPVHMRLDGGDDWIHHLGSSTGMIRIWASSPL